MSTFSDAVRRHDYTLSDHCRLHRQHPLVRLQRMPGKTSNTIPVKLEGNNPAGSVRTARHCR